MTSDTENKPTISIITPVYQVEDYVAECLNSLLAQSYEDLEIIVVNDGSTDGSRAIVARIAETDNRIRIIDQENSGLSSARNTGIDAARGNILMFVDSDDMLVEEACMKVVEAFSSTPAEIVVFGGLAYPSETDYPWLHEALSPRRKEYEGFQPELLFRENAEPYVWRTAISAEFFARTKLRFDEELRFGEDAVFLFMAYPQSLFTSLIPDKLYLYRQNRHGSLMQENHFVHQYNRVNEHLRIARAVLEGWQANGWIDLWPAEIFAWALRFVVFYIDEQEDNRRVELLENFRDMVLPYIQARDLKADGLGKASIDIYSSVCQENPELSRKQLRKLSIQQKSLVESATDIMKQLRNRVSIKHLLKFTVVGFNAFLIDYGLLILLTEAFHIHYLASATISFSVSVFFNYIASMRFVFPHKEGWRRSSEFLVFMVLSVVGLLLNNLGMWLGVDIITLDYRITKPIVTLLVTIWNYVSRMLFFRD